MREIANIDGYKIIEEYPGYPSIWSIAGTDIQIISSPFANCQTFSIMNVHNFIHLPIKTVANILKEPVKKFLKRQVTLDLTKKDFEPFVKHIKPFIRQINRKSYINNNDTEMVLCVIKLNTNKLYEY
jgi:hypothetical protein